MTERANPWRSPFDPNVRFGGLIDGMDIKPGPPPLLQISDILERYAERLGVSRAPFPGAERAPLGPSAALMSGAQGAPGADEGADALSDEVRAYLFQQTGHPSWLRPSAWQQGNGGHVYAAEGGSGAGDRLVKAALAAPGAAAPAARPAIGPYAPPKPPAVRDGLDPYSPEFWVSRPKASGSRYWQGWEPFWWYYPGTTEKVPETRELRPPPYVDPEISLEERRKKYRQDYEDKPPKALGEDAYRSRWFSSPDENQNGIPDVIERGTAAYGFDTRRWFGF